MKKILEFIVDHEVFFYMLINSLLIYLLFTNETYGFTAF